MGTESRTRFRPSIYNIFSDRVADHVALFNTLTQNLAILSSEELVALSSGDSSNKDFVRLGFLVPVDLDERELAFRMNARDRDVDLIDPALTLTIVPSLACNFSCTYCYNGVEHKPSRAKEVCENAISYVAANLVGGEPVHVTWYGGEPTLLLGTIQESTRALKEICEAKGSPYSADMLTNGRVLTEKVGDRLSECGIVELQVSVDIPVSRSPRHLRNETAEQSLLEVLSRINHIPSDVKVNLRVNAFPGFLDEFEPFADECQHRIDRDVYVYLHRVFESNVAVMNTAEAASLRYHDPSRFYRELLIAKNALRSRGFFQEYYPRGYQTGTCMAQNRRKLIFSPDGLRICVREVAGPGARVVEGIPNSVAAFYYSDSVSAKDLCWECEFLPLCQGGCVKERLERRSEYDKRCVPWKFVLRDELTEYLTREEGVAR